MVRMHTDSNGVVWSLEGDEWVPLAPSRRASVPPPASEFRKVLPHPIDDPDDLPSSAELELLRTVRRFHSTDPAVRDRAVTTLIKSLGVDGAALAVEYL